MYEGVAYSAIWKFMSWLPGFVVRQFITKRWLAEKTRIDVRARHSSVQIVGGEMPNATIWLNIHNGGYFPIELDRLTAELWLAGCNVQFYYLDRTLIPAGETRELYLKGNLTPGQIAHYTRNRAGDVLLSVRAEFNSDIHDFSVNTGQLSGIKPDTPGI